MLQVASFALPGEQDKANAFLQTVKVTNTSFNKDMIVVFYDDGTVSIGQQIADLKELRASSRVARFQQEVALHVLKAELADLNATHNANRFQEVSAAIRNVQDAIANQDLKADFVSTRIAELEATLPQKNG
jgi:hypothetical protein